MNAPGPRTVHVEHCMGTVFSIDIRDDPNSGNGGDWTAALKQAVDWLHHVDEVFSTYRADSAISRLGRGEITESDCSAEVRGVLRVCAQLTTLTGGYFSAYPAGSLDPSGLVKGWAIERASEILRAHGSSNHAVNGGGDVQVAGEREPGQPWRIGISDPNDRTALAEVVQLREGSVATSGTAERGTHVINPLTGRPAAELASVTVVGRHLTQVDAYATAALAMGPACRFWLARLPGCAAMVLAADGSRWQTANFANWATN